MFTAKDDLRHVTLDDFGLPATLDDVADRTADLGKVDEIVNLKLPQMMYCYLHSTGCVKS